VNHDGYTVAISISAPEESQLAARGLSLDHVRHAYIELARQILARGGSLAYGGNPLADKPSYVQILIALLRTYSNPDRPPPERIQLYLAAPIWRKLGSDVRAELCNFATLTEVDAVAGAPLEVAGGQPGLGPHFTAMREAMAAETDARVVLGGRLEKPFAGRWPGIVEEAYLTQRCGRPLYVAAGLGGAAALVADLIRGRERPDIDLADEATLRAAFEHADLHNGLTSEENALLFETADLDLVVALVLRGLEAPPR
jgi:hypothetical protein